MVPDWSDVDDRLGNVVFSDELRFCLSSDSRRIRVWRRCGDRSNPAVTVERLTARQRGIMVWGAIAYDSRSPLVRIQDTMTAQGYLDNVVRPVAIPDLQRLPNAIFQQDNARSHSARICQHALQGMQMLPWPPYSSDLSPIEHVWDVIGRRLQTLPLPRSEDELWQMVERECFLKIIIQLPENQYWQIVVHVTSIRLGD
ncbi:Transposable element Tc1 transposase, partial [Stegodyphus mimosarum]